MRNTRREIPEIAGPLIRKTYVSLHDNMYYFDIPRLKCSSFHLRPLTLFECFPRRDENDDRWLVHENDVTFKTYAHCAV